MKNILVVFALKSETGGAFKEANVLFTGIGKVNAAYALTKKLQTEKPDLVLNLGTVGSSKFPIREVVYASQFRDVDFDTSALKNFLSQNTPHFPSYKNALNLKTGICHTTDKFQTSPGHELVDMEAYALAKVCMLENVRFCSYKFVSDNVNEQAPDDWKDSLKESGEVLYDVYKRVMESL